MKNELINELERPIKVQRFKMVEAEYGEERLKRVISFYNPLRPDDEVVSKDKYPLLHKKWDGYYDDTFRFYSLFPDEIDFNDDLYHTINVNDRLSPNCFTSDSDLGNEIIRFLIDKDLYFFTETRIFFSANHKMFTFSLINIDYLPYKF